MPPGLGVKDSSGTTESGSNEEKREAGEALERRGSHRALKGLKAVLFESRWYLRRNMGYNLMRAIYSPFHFLSL